jgi:hypothetical protein
MPQLHYIFALPALQILCSSVLLCQENTRGEQLYHFEFPNDNVNGTAIQSLGIVIPTTIIHGSGILILYLPP